MVADVKSGHRGVAMRVLQRQSGKIGPSDPLTGSAPDAGDSRRRPRSVHPSRPGGLNLVVLLAIIGVMVLAAAALIEGPRVGVQDVVPAETSQPEMP